MAKPGGPKRVLFSLFQAPYDPASGAALATLSMMKILAARPERFSVRCIATTSTEARKLDPPLVHLSRRGVKATLDAKGAVGKARPLVRFEDEGVTFTLLDTRPAMPLEWDKDPALSAQFNRLLAGELGSFKPDLLATYGGRPNDQLRRQAIWSAGTAVVQLVHNMAYLNTEAFQYTDAVWVPSAFCAARYREVAGVSPVWIPPPADRADVLCTTRKPERILMVNPNAQKGAFVMIRLIDDLRQRRPDIPLEMIEGRATARELCDEAMKHGIDLRSHPNLVFTPTVPRSSLVFERARVLVMPSVWVEPFGKLAAEAMVNGVPTLVSRSGGLAESIGQAHDAPAIGDIRQAAPSAGFVLPLPAWLTPQVRRPISSEEAAPWVEAVIRLHDDRAFYDACAACTAQAAQQVREDQLHPRYAEFFEGITQNWTPPPLLSPLV